MKQPWNPKRVETKQPKGPRTTGVFPFYRSVGGHDQKAAYSIDVGDHVPGFENGQVVLDFLEDGTWIGVEIIGVNKSEN